jgi:hypothetical protein
LSFLFILFEETESKSESNHNSSICKKGEKSFIPLEGMSQGGMLCILEAGGDGEGFLVGLGRLTVGEVQDIQEGQP